MWASLSSPSGCIDTLGEITRLPFPVACGPPSLLPRAASTHTNSPSGTPMLANARRHVWWVEQGRARNANAALAQTLEDIPC